MNRIDKSCKNGEKFINGSCVPFNSSGKTGGDAIMQRKVRHLNSNVRHTLSPRKRNFIYSPVMKTMVE